jgi:hypothetical protein
MRFFILSVFILMVSVICSVVAICYTPTSDSHGLQEPVAARRHDAGAGSVLPDLKKVYPLQEITSPRCLCFLQLYNGFV